MKTFLNVLYRRILYKIPLKLLLVLLVVFGVLCACFSKAETFENVFISLKVISAGGSFTQTYSDQNWDNICFAGSSAGLSVKDPNNVSHTVPISNADLGQNNFICFNDVGTYVITNPGGGSKTLYFIRWNNFSCPSQYTSLECQTEYNLIPISSVDQNYCTTNNLCPSCPVCPSVPILTGGYSQLYINNILHLGAPNIIMNIPDEIDWDYAYTAGGQNMNIDVVGYNVDYDKIDSIVAFQNYKPSSEDFQKIIGLLAPYTKIIVFFVFLFIVWAWIKKPFKSKKL